MQILPIKKLYLPALSIVAVGFILNALQALPLKGKIGIGAELDASDSQLHLWVKDDGPGIPSNQIEKENQ